MTTRTKILTTADQAISVDRDEVYGPVRGNFERIANAWRALGFADVTPEEVALMMIIVKASRLTNTLSHEDSWVDLAGYAALGGEIATS